MDLIGKNTKYYIPLNNPNSSNNNYHADGVAKVARPSAANTEFISFSNVQSLPGQSTGNNDSGSMNQKDSINNSNSGNNNNNNSNNNNNCSSANINNNNDKSDQKEAPKCGGHYAALVGNAPVMPSALKRRSKIAAHDTSQNNSNSTDRDPQHSSSQSSAAVSSSNIISMAQSADRGSSVRCMPLPPPPLQGTKHGDSHSNSGSLKLSTSGHLESGQNHNYNDNNSNAEPAHADVPTPFVSASCSYEDPAARLRAGQPSTLPNPIVLVTRQSSTDNITDGNQHTLASPKGLEQEHSGGFDAAASEGADEEAVPNSHANNSKKRHKSKTVVMFQVPKPQPVYYGISDVSDDDDLQSVNSVHLILNNNSRLGSAQSTPSGDNDGSTSRKSSAKRGGSRRNRTAKNIDGYQFVDAGQSQHSSITFMNSNTSCRTDSIGSIASGAVQGAQANDDKPLPMLTSTVPRTLSVESTSSSLPPSALIVKSFAFLNSQMNSHSVSFSASASQKNLGSAKESSANSVFPKGDESAPPGGKRRGKDTGTHTAGSEAPTEGAAYLDIDEEGEENEESKGKQAKASRDVESTDPQLATAQRLRRRQLLFLFGVATFSVICAVIIGLVVYFLSWNAMAKGSIERSEVILKMALLYTRYTIQRMKTFTIEVSNYINYYGREYQSSTEVHNELNTTFFYILACRIIDPTSLYALGLQFYFPNVPRAKIPPQNHSEQYGCSTMCRRPGDPRYTDVYYVVVDSEVLYTGQQEYTFATTRGNNTHATAYIMKEMPLADQPPVYRMDDALRNITLFNLDFKHGPLGKVHRSVQLRHSERVAYSFNAHVMLENGTYEDGALEPMKLWVSSDERTYAYIGYRRTFFIGDMAFGVSSFAMMLDWAEQLTKFFSTGEEESLTIVDREERLMLYTGDGVQGDPRHMDCSFLNDSYDGVMFSCRDVRAATHPSAFVRALVRGYHERLFSSVDVEPHWVEILNRRYLLASKDILTTIEVRFIAIYTISEERALGGDLMKKTMAVVIISILMVTLSAVLLTVTSFFALRQALKIIEDVAAIAGHVARYDLVAAEEVRSRKGFDAVIGKQFSLILDNLEAYRPFLPPSLLRRHLEKNKGTSGARAKVALDHNKQRDNFDDIAKMDSILGNSSTSLFLSSLSSNFRRARGTVLIISLDDTIKLNILDAAVTDFTQIAMPVVERFGGSIDLIQGNELLISFNFYSEVKNHEDVACRCAMTVSREFLLTPSSLNNNTPGEQGRDKTGSPEMMSITGRTFGEAGPRCIHMAITSGLVMLGTAGGDEQKSRVATGEPIDLARKMISLQRLLGISHLVTEQVAENTSLATVPIDVLLPQWYQSGRTRRVTVYELHEMRKVAMPLTLIRMCEAFHKLQTLGADQAEVAYKNLDHPQASRLAQLCKTLVAGKHSIEGRREVTWEPIEGMDCLAPNAKSLIDSVGGLAEDFTAGEMSRAQEKLEAMEEKKRQDHHSMEYVRSETALFSLYIPPEEKRFFEEMGRCIRSIGDIGEFSSSRLLKTITDTHNEKYIRTERTLGRGQFGEVWLAMHETGLLVAMKAIALTGDYDTSELLREISLLREIKHANIAGYVSCAVSEEHLYVMMEYLSAGSLRGLLGCVGQLPPPAVARYMVDVLTGLAFLHDNGIVHCDIKPDNVLMLGDSTCKLADFGTARMLTGANSTRAVRGTVRYMAPEAVLGGWTQASDMYSVGIMIVELATGVNPWSHINSDEATFLAHLTNERNPLEPVIPDSLHPVLKDIAERCLSRKTDQRPTAKTILSSGQLNAMFKEFN